MFATLASVPSLARWRLPRVSTRSDDAPSRRASRVAPARAIIERSATEEGTDEGVGEVARERTEDLDAAAGSSSSGAAAASDRSRRASKMPNCFADTTAIDDELSNRWIDLDPAGYFLVAVDEEEGTIRAAHFKNVINEDGKACDPVTGEVIPCDGSYKPTANATFEGRTAKELSVKILEEEEGKGTVTMLVHANYLGREFQRAEQCLAEGREYVQD